MKPIPVIIPFFKNHEALQKSTEHLYKQTLPAEVFVRDNSFDNILFTRAVNEGLRKFCFDNSNEFVLVLSQDAYLAENCLEELVNAMRKYPKCGIATPVAQSQRGDITWYGGLDAYPLGVHRGRGPQYQNQTEPFKSHWANGACMLLRIEMVKEIGLLDENMKFIYSDSDYSFTARSRGWAILVAPLAVMEHTLAGSGVVNNDWLNSIKLMDQIYFAEKWLTGDVYKKLAYEGSKLSPQLIAESVANSRSHLNSFRR